MQRLTILEFGKSKLILGGEPRSNGFNTTQFLLQLNRLISESGASRYLNGLFRVEDSSLMNNEAREIHLCWEIGKENHSRWLTTLQLVQYYSFSTANQSTSNHLDRVQLEVICSFVEYLVVSC